MKASLFLLIGLCSQVFGEHDPHLKSRLKFAADLYGSISQDKPSENLIVSPLSVGTALGLLLVAADGSTAQEISRGLHLSTTNRSHVAPQFEQMLQRVNPKILKIANKIYIGNGYELNPEFDLTARKFFKSETEKLNFAEGVQAAQAMNSWVKDNTNNKIKELIKPSQLNANTEAVLVNAVHFRAQWENQFPKQYTKKGDFWISENESIQVDMMNGKSKIEFGENKDLDAKIALIPYKDNVAYMMIILPNSRSGLSQVEAKLQSHDFEKSFSELHSTMAFIQMPKFNVDATVDLKTILSKMGISEIFSSSANLSHLLSSSKRLRIDDAIHKAFITVDEDGTEAGAATSVRASTLKRPQEFKVDRPFIFAVASRKIVFFLGSLLRT